MAPMARRTKADIHPELRRIARVLPRGGLNRWSLALLRRLPIRPGGDKGVEILTLPSGVGVRLYRPRGVDDPAPALLWIHGGGYVLGHAGMDDALCRRYVEQLGIVVAAVDYRLAPENPYPIPLEDCYSALTWLAGLPGVDSDRIAIGGLSAGGGLTAALAFLARDRGEVSPVLQLLSYPMLDNSAVDKDLDRPGSRIWNTGNNRFGWTAYLGDADAEVAVPARRADLHGLPPAWLGVGTLDLLHDEGVAYAARLSAAGVPCELHLVPGAFHGFDQVAPNSAVAQDYFDMQCAHLRHAMGLAPGHAMGLAPGHAMGLTQTPCPTL